MQKWRNSVSEISQENLTTRRQTHWSYLKFFHNLRRVCPMEYERPCSPSFSSLLEKTRGSSRIFHRGQTNSALVSKTLDRFSNSENRTPISRSTLTFYPYLPANLQLVYTKIYHIFTKKNKLKHNFCLYEIAFFFLLKLQSMNSRKMYNLTDVQILL
jgi:hypothetical protein